jgi:hypothetical protein
MKRRCDRNHAVYQIVCRPTGERYIGITVVRGRAFQKSVKIRWQGHIYHAMVEDRQYPLQQRIREYGPDAFAHELICVIRGKQAAHDYERDLIVTTRPELNVECTGRKPPRQTVPSHNERA